MNLSRRHVGVVVFVVVAEVAEVAVEVVLMWLLRAHRSTHASWTSLPVSEGTEGNSLRFAKRIALANELEKSEESTWDLTSHNFRVVAK